MIITSAPHCYSSQRLYEEYKKLFGREPTMLNPKNVNSYQWLALESRVPPEAVLIRSTGIDYDDSDLLFAKYLHHKGVTFVQNNHELQLFRDKLHQFLFYRQNSIHTPDTLFIKGEDFSIPQWQGEKYIVKTRRGMKGFGVTYVEGKKSLGSLLKTLWSINDQNFIVQPYIQGVEFRFFVCKRQIISVLRRDKRGITANSGSDTQVTSIPVSQAPTEQVKKLISHISSHYYAIDLLLTTDGKQVILECNLAPGFEQLEKISDLNIARLIWNYKAVKK